MIGAERFILIGCLLQGALGSDWAVWMPQSIEALIGSCVLIPCRFEIPSEYDSDLLQDPSSVNGKWKKDETIVFDSSSQSASSLHGKITGDLLQKKCTTVLENLPMNYHGRYKFRLECNNRLKWNFKQSVQINITASPPKPKLTPERVEVMEGTSVSLSCSAAAPCPKLPPNLTWTPRLSDSVGQLQENVSVSSVLTFTASHLHHGQNITCRALYKLQQGDTQKTTEASLTLRVLYAPKNTSVSVSPSGSVLVGSSVTLTCSSNANPAVKKYTWHKVSGTEMNTVGTGQNLTFNVIESSGSEQYYCEAQNEHGKEKSKTVQLELDYPPKNTSVSVSPSGSMLEGSSVTLTCSSNANPAVQNYTWYKVNGTEMNTVGTGQNLTFTVTESSGSEQYYCEAQNEHGKENSTVQLEVDYPPKNTSVSVSPSGSVLEGSSVTLTCSSNANPAVQNYTWYKVNGTEMNTVGTGQNLTFNVTESSGSEQYYCEAQNKHGKENSTVQLEVYYPPKNTSVSVSPSGSLLVGSSVTLTCSSNAKPEVQNYTWYKVNGTKMNTVGTGQNLTFTVTESSGSEQYYCEAQNKHGKENSTVQLEVYYPPKNTSVSNSLSGSVLAGSSVTLTCSSNAKPAVQNYTWYKVNGTEMNTVGTGQNLTFNVTESSGSEQYYCEAQNEHGKDNSANVQLNVIYMPQISGSGSCSRTAAEISCSCESRGNPSPSMEWRVSGLRVTNSTDRVIREEQLGNTGLRSSLTMRQSQGDTPTLLCISTNTLGSSSLQLHLPSPQQHSGFGSPSLLIAAAAGAGAMMMICLTMQLILKKKRDSQYSGSRMKDGEGLTLTDETAAQDEESIYANKTMLSEAGAVEKGDEGALHYATVDFSKLPGTGGEHGTGIVRGTSKRTPDYAVIRHKSREEREGGEEEGEEVQEEVEKEGQAELGTERDSAEARGKKEEESRPNLSPQASVNPEPTEEATYGNICRSRPTKRARQGLQQPPRNPAAEEEQEEQRQEENSAGGQEDIYVDVMSPLTEGNGKGTEESAYAEVRKPK
ncbi:B-cell receptor CD22-like isoform X2 [Anguilla rostrata]|uniref:B-cell receptor CD22-like isoform X2 n=1 Tax=Anguilla rostrata TaxID=7938 RepID=UPI0030D48E54